MSDPKNPVICCREFGTPGCRCWEYDICMGGDRPRIYAQAVLPAVRMAEHFQRQRDRARKLAVALLRRDRARARRCRALLTRAQRAEHARNEALAESARRYDCHGGPGTTQPACNACITCLLRE